MSNILPSDILRHIAANLNGSDVIRLGYTSKCMKLVLKNEIRASKQPHKIMMDILNKCKLRLEYLTALAPIQHMRVSFNVSCITRVDFTFKGTGSVKVDVVSHRMHSMYVSGDMQDVANDLKRVMKSNRELNSITTNAKYSVHIHMTHQDYIKYVIEMNDPIINFMLPQFLDHKVIYTIL
jgi:hypothetical protein